MSSKLKFGLLNGKVVHISEVENGKNCNCYCPNEECNGKLVAKNNSENIKIPHFSHLTKTDCIGGDESAIHKYAKQLILEYKQIYLPNFELIDTKSEICFSKKGYLITFDDVKLEKQYKIEDTYIQPDAVGILNGRELFIEFAKTSFVQQDKLEKIKKLNKSCIEINLHSFLSLDLKKVLFENISFYEYNYNDKIKPIKYWINNPELKNLAIKHFELELFKLEEEKKEENRLEQLRKEKLKLEEEKIEDYCKKNNLLIYQIKRENEVPAYTHEWESKTETKIYASDCKLRLDILKEKKYSFNSREWNDPIIRRILEGDYWDGKIYENSYWDNHYPRHFVEDSSGKGKWIILAGEEINVMPTKNGMLSNRNEISIEYYDFLVQSLKKISKLLYNYGKCIGCKFNRKIFVFKGKECVVCKYSCTI